MTRSQRRRRMMNALRWCIVRARIQTSVATAMVRTGFHTGEVVGARECTGINAETVATHRWMSRRVGQPSGGITVVTALMTAATRLASRSALSTTAIPATVAVSATVLRSAVRSSILSPSRTSHLGLA